MVRRTVVVMVVLVVLAGTGGVTAAAASEDAPQGQPAAVPPLECGTIPDHDVRLTADLTCTEPFTMPGSEPPQFYVPPDWELRPTIDLAGHTLDISAIAIRCHPGAPSLLFPCGMVGPFRFVNGTIRGNIGNVFLLDQVMVHGVVWLGFTAQGVSLVGATMQRSGIVDGVVHVGSEVTIERSGFFRSSVDNALNEAAVRLTLRDNVFFRSPGPAAVWLQDRLGVGNDIGATVERNLFVRPEGPGILVTGSEFAFAPVLISHNLVALGRDDGIRVEVGVNEALPRPDEDSITLAGNLAVVNRGHGIVVDAGSPERGFVVDGGHNHAAANGLSPQCVGISCC